jgi:hypothetical protein
MLQALKAQQVNVRLKAHHHRRASTPCTGGKNKAQNPAANTTAAQAMMRHGAPAWPKRASAHKPMIGSATASSSRLPSSTMPSAAKGTPNWLA